MKKVGIRYDQFLANLLGFCVLLAVAGGIAVAVWFLHLLNQSQPQFWLNSELLGMAGEFLGGTVGSIWALAGVILFFLALIYQKRELVLQREELKESRKIMESQSSTIAIQQFENTFFQLLNFHVNASNTIRNTILGTNGSSLNGFDSLFKDFKKEVQLLKRRRKKDSVAVSPDDESYDLCFRTVYSGYKNTFQHYLENYRTLVVLIEAKSHDPIFYFNILKSHFTEQEVLVQFYYTVLFAKDKELSHAAEKYGLFHKLNLRAVAEIDSYHLDKVDKNAYAHSKG